MWLAKEALLAEVPEGWETGSTPEGTMYYFNATTGESSWEHPLDGVYRQRYAELKANPARAARRSGGGGPGVAVLAPPPSDDDFEVDEDVEALMTSTLAKSPAPAPAPGAVATAPLGRIASPHVLGSGLDYRRLSPAGAPSPPTGPGARPSPPQSSSAAPARGGGSPSALGRSPPPVGSSPSQRSPPGQPRRLDAATGSPVAASPDGTMSSPPGSGVRRAGAQLAPLRLPGVNPPSSSAADLTNSGTAAPSRTAAVVGGSEGAPTSAPHSDAEGGGGGGLTSASDWDESESDSAFLRVMTGRGGSRPPSPEVAPATPPLTTHTSSHKLVQIGSPVDHGNSAAAAGASPPPGGSALPHTRSFSAAVAAATADALRSPTRPAGVSTPSASASPSLKRVGSAGSAGVSADARNAGRPNVVVEVMSGPAASCTGATASTAASSPRLVSTRYTVEAGEEETGLPSGRSAADRDRAHSADPGQRTLSRSMTSNVLRSHSRTAGEEVSLQRRIDKAVAAARVEWEMEQLADKSRAANAGAKMSADLARTQTERDELVARTTRAVGEASVANARVATLEAALAEALDKVKAVAAERDALDAERARAVAAAASARNDAAARTAEMQAQVAAAERALEEERAARAADADRTEAALQLARSETRDRRVEVSERLAEIASLSEQLAQARSVARSHESHATESSSAMGMLRDTNAQLDLDLKAARAEKAAAQARIGQLELEAGQVQATVAELRAQIADLQAKERQALDGAASARGSAASRVAALEREVAQLQAASAEAASAAQAELASLRAAHALALQASAEEADRRVAEAVGKWDRDRIAAREERAALEVSVCTASERAPPTLGRNDELGGGRGGGQRQRSHVKRHHVVTGVVAVADICRCKCALLIAAGSHAPFLSRSHQRC